MPRRRHGRSTGRTRCARRTGCASSGRPSTGSTTSRPTRSTRHLDARLGAAAGQRPTARSSTSPQQAMQRGAEALGWSFATVTRNWDPRQHDPAMAGYMGFGDQSGAKQSTLKTYLQDAVDRGARDRRAAASPSACSSRAAAPPGVEATLDRPGDRRRPRASPSARRRSSSRRARSSRPALLLRSGIGGPAVGELPAPAPVHRDARRLRRGHAGVVGRAARRPRQRVRERRGRLRLPHRGRAVHDRRSAPRRSRSRPAREHKQAMADYRNGGDVHRPHPRPRPRPGDDRRATARRCRGTR